MAVRAVSVVAVALSLLLSIAQSPAVPTLPSPADPAEVGVVAPPVVRSTGPSPDSPPTEADEPDREPELIEGEARIDVAQDGALRFDGRPTDGAGLTIALAAFADADRDEKTDRCISRRAVRVVADPATPWRHVRRVLADCTGPSVRIARLRITAGGTERVAVPAERLLREGELVRFEEKPLIESTLDTGSGRGIRIRLLDRWLGRGDAARAELNRLLRIIVRGNHDLDGEIRADGGIPAGAVVRILRSYRRAGVPRTHLEGVPPRHWETAMLVRELDSDARVNLEPRLRALLRSRGVRMGIGDLVVFFEGAGKVRLPELIPILLRTAAEEDKTCPACEPPCPTPSEEFLQMLGKSAAPILGREARRGSIAAIQVLGRMWEGDADPALEDIHTAARSRSEDVRHAAIRALGKFGKKEPRLRTLFQRVAGDPAETEDIRRYARACLRKGWK